MCGCLSTSTGVFDWITKRSRCLCPSTIPPEKHWRNWSMPDPYLGWMVILVIAMGVSGFPMVIWSIIVEDRLRRIKAEIRQMDALCQEIEELSQQEPPCDTAEPS